MFSGQHHEELLRRRAVMQRNQTDLHHVALPGTLPQDISAIQSPEGASTPVHRSSQDEGGTWGERDIGGPVSRHDAMLDLEEMRMELTRLSLQRSRTRDSVAARPGTSLWRARTTGSIARVRTKESRRESDFGSEFEKDVEAGPEPIEEEDFDMGDFLRNGYFEKRLPEGDSAKKIGVVYKHLTIKGVDMSAAFTKTLPEAIIGTFGPDLYRILCKFFPVLQFGKKPPTRNLINDFSGVVRDGEMMLVLGRPGSGCSTFLKAIANQRGTFAAVEGEVTYGGISAEEQAKHYKGEVNYNPEDDQHLPNLNVWQTLQFALMNKTRKHESEAIPVIINSLLKVFGIPHTKHTLVGNEYVRGVSGGERKRVGIAETLTTKSTVVCWDNSTRGLDASTALDYAKSLRVMTDISKRTTIVTLYQAGEGIYELMDKVLVIEHGRMIYQGPAKDARQYFINLGFHCPDRQTTADFLTSIGDPNERQFQKGKEHSTPKTAEELEAAFRASDIYKQSLADVSNYEEQIHTTSHAATRQFQQAVVEQKSNSRMVPRRSNYTISFWRQVLACTLREYWLFWGDKTTLYTKFFIIISNALIVGSLFFGESLNTSGAFPRGGALFFSILFLGWLQLTELMKAVGGRVVVARHRDYAFYRPSAVVIARVLLDFPVVAVQAVIFSVILYFMAGLDISASKFFIYLLFVYTTTLNLTALYRMFASLSPTIDDAVRFAGLALNLLVIYVGYVIPKQNLTQDVIWFGWLYYVNPVSYSYEGVLSNEFSGRTMACDPTQLIPQGPGINPAYQACALIGAQLGSPNVSGEDYLSVSFSYSRSHLWRNWGVLVAFTILYILVTAVASEIFSFAEESGGALIFKKGKKIKKQVLEQKKSSDEEKSSSALASSSSRSSDTAQNGEESIVNEISKAKSVFTWENVTFDVPYHGGTRRLLNGVNGYVKPGIMIALMGASGAGKTTLLNTLSQRQTVGTVKGDMLVDGRPLGIEFQRGTGFCEQMDLHDGTATIREALEFSAILRQDRNVPEQEKLDYVKSIISLLELEDIQDALIMSLGVEQRKRLTIGVELAAKPDLLLFLDEPTSGLDSQSAFSIVRFLKKLSQAGQAIICTIHQPSSMLIQQFDMVLALNPGGNTFYFGGVGENGSTIVNYFGERGVVCPPTKNVAEFLLETAAKPIRGKDGKRINWNKEWLKSKENEEMLAEIHRLKEQRSTLAKDQSRAKEYAFAATVPTQTYMLTKRTFLQYWRDPSYLYAKVFISVIIGIFNGFTFYKLDNSLASLQSRLFTPFMIILIPPTIVNGVVPKFYVNRELWETREYPSRIYGWIAFCTAQVVAEIPMAIITSVIYWVLWYYPTGLPTDTATAGYVFLMSMLFFLFQASWGQWICAFAPSFTVISNVLPFFFVMFSLFNGIVRPYAQLPVFWRFWVYWANPATYWLNGVMASVLTGFQVECKPGEATIFNPPPGQSCASYASDFVRSAGRGYLVNPDAHQQCGYCPYSSGEEYLATLNVSPSQKWRDFGIFFLFVWTNWLLVYFFIYTVRVKGWSFGMKSLFGGLGSMMDMAKKRFQRNKTDEIEKN